MDNRNRNEIITLIITILISSLCIVLAIFDIVPFLSGTLFGVTLILMLTSITQLISNIKYYNKKRK